jgi:hypothetical protein
MPVSPELTLDIPVSEIPGVWRATRLAMLFGPTPALWIYRKASTLAERARPVVRRTLLQTVDKMQSWAGGSQMSSPHHSWRRLSSSSRRSHERQKSFAASTAAALALGSGIGPFISAAGLRVYYGIINDPRLQKQRLRDSRIMLEGELSISSFQKFYRDYRETLDLTLEVAQGTISTLIFRNVERKFRLDKTWRPDTFQYLVCEFALSLSVTENPSEHIARSGLSPKDARTVHNLVLTGIEARR